MRIAVNTQLLLKDRLEGLGWFTFETLKRITNNHPEHEFIFIFDRDWHDDFIFSDNITPVKTALPSRHPVLYYLRFEHLIPRILKKYRADVFLSPDGWSTLKTDVKKVTVIHDIGFVHTPEQFPYAYRKYLNYYFPRFAHHSDQLATVSNYSKNDMVNTWKIPDAKIEVIYNGSNDIYMPLPEKTVLETRNEITGGHPYFIYVGAINPRKNVEGMLQAFDAFKNESGLPHKLVIVGEKMWKNDSVDKVYQSLKHKNDIVFTGRLAPEKLHHVLASAHALLLVSFLEGFGIPLVEAMNCDVPVITSNITAMPEIAGDAGHLINPANIESITHGLLKLAKDEAYRQKLIENGRKQRKLFTWDKTAEALWSLIEKTES